MAHSIGKYPYHCVPFRQNKQTLYRWREQFVRSGQDGLSNGSSGTGERREMERMRRELSARDQVIGELTIANRVLKKTWAPEGDGAAERAGSPDA